MIDYPISKKASLYIHYVHTLCTELYNEIYSEIILQ